MVSPVDGVGVGVAAVLVVNDCPGSPSPALFDGNDVRRFKVVGHINAQF